MSYRKHLMPSNISPSEMYAATAVESDTDTISRQQAIDAVNSLTYPSSLMDVKRKLIELPPAGPQIIRCKDCKYREYYRESGYMCRLDTGDPYMTGRNAEDDDWFCADAERKEVTT